jgi:hypothetical protein
VHYGRKLPPSQERPYKCMERRWWLLPSHDAREKLPVPALISPAGDLVEVHIHPALFPAPRTYPCSCGCVLSDNSQLTKRWLAPRTAARLSKPRIKLRTTQNRCRKEFFAASLAIHQRVCRSVGEVCSPAAHSPFLASGWPCARGKVSAGGCRNADYLPSRITAASARRCAQCGCVAVACRGSVCLRHCPLVLGKLLPENKDPCPRLVGFRTLYPRGNPPSAVS